MACRITLMKDPDLDASELKRLNRIIERLKDEEKNVDDAVTML